MVLPVGVTDGGSWVPTDTFAGRLILVRKELGLGQEEAAQRCDLKPSTWATWELGRSPRNLVQVVRTIHERLGVDRDWLMWGGPLRSRCFAHLPGQDDPYPPKPRIGRHLELVAGR
jgi:transcriptional regulator with XRE-family HTH domain